MKSYRRIVTLLLCLLLICTASCASAATKKLTKTFTEVPTIRFTDAPSSGTRPGESNDLTISASIPGFLNLYIVDESGNIHLTIAKNKEIPSKSTTFDFWAIDDNGNPMTPGDYMFSAELVSQFGEIEFAAACLVGGHLLHHAFGVGEFDGRGGEAAASDG